MYASDAAGSIVGYAHFGDPKDIYGSWVELRVSLGGVSGVQTAVLDYRVGNGAWQSIGAVPTQPAFSADHFGFAIHSAMEADDMSFGSVRSPPGTLMLIR